MHKSKSINSVLKKRINVQLDCNFAAMGENIKLARKRRFISAIRLANNAKINRSTLYHIEKGMSNVSIYAYVCVLIELGFFDEIFKIIEADKEGRSSYEMKSLIHASKKEYKI